MKKILIILACFLICLNIYSRGQQRHAESYGSELSNKKILILADSSDFKNSVIKKTITNLSNNYYILVDSVSMIDSYETSEYDFYIVISTVKARNIKSKVRKFVIHENYQDKVLLSITSSSGDWEKKIDGVDVVTSASETSEVDKVVSNIISWINKKGAA